MPTMSVGAGQPVPTSRSEKRYNVLVATIERWQRKLEKADKTVRRAVLTITKLERQRRRLQKRMAADETAKANAIVTAVAEPVEITAEPVADLTIPGFLQRNGDGAPKAKRKRKAKG